MSKPAIKILIAGGGTGGHVQPAIATIQALRRRLPVELLWIGSQDGLERRSARAEGIPFLSISTGKLRRYFSLRTPVDGLRVPVGIMQAYWIIRRYHPDVVFSTGGFVSVPGVIAARMAGVPSLSHEQTAIAGLATRINAGFCDVVALSFETSAAALSGSRARIAVTGNPVRPEILRGNAAAARERFGLSDDLPVIYITGGALGAHAINDAVRGLLPELLSITQVVHQCGPAQGNGDYPHLVDAREQLSPDLRRRYVVTEFLGPELADVYAAARLVVGRAGAGTVAELAALGKPSILIPLPGTGGDEQTHNAGILAMAGASLLLPQSALTPDHLGKAISSLLSDDGRLQTMAASARLQARSDAAELLVDQLLQLAGASTTPLSGALERFGKR